VITRGIVCITGGTGFRYVAEKMAQKGTFVTYVQPASDSGRSSRELRLLFAMPAVGDLRSRLIDIADKTAAGYKAIMDVLSYRLGKDPAYPDPEVELQEVIDLQHPLAKKLCDPGQVPRGFANIFRGHLQYFDAARQSYELGEQKKFDLANGSIGNFFLAGAYLYHLYDLESAIYLFGKLVNIRGEVIPSSLENIHLGAELEDGTRLIGQHNITKKMSPSPIKSLFYLDREDLATGKLIGPQLNEAAAEAIRTAETLVFSMGSFYTSILCNIHLMGMSEAVRQSPALKIFIANPTEDAETVGMTAGTMAAKLIETLRSHDPSPSAKDADYLNLVITGDHQGTASYKNGFNYLSPDTSAVPVGVHVSRYPLDSDGHYRVERMASDLPVLASAMHSIFRSA
jgi:CofD-related protein of GAK system